MTLKVRPESAVPIYEQIITQMIFAIANEDWSAGDLLPSVRDLASQLVVNPNTVVRSYQELERDGIIETRRGMGMAVTVNAVKICLDKRKNIVRDRLKDAIREAVSAGLAPADVCQMVHDEWPKGKK